eukprot:gene7976-10816_t
MTSARIQQLCDLVKSKEHLKNASLVSNITLVDKVEVNGIKRYPSRNQPHRLLQQYSRDEVAHKSIFTTRVHKGILSDVFGEIGANMDSSDKILLPTSLIIEYMLACAWKCQSRLGVTSNHNHTIVANVHNFISMENFQLLKMVKVRDIRGVVGGKPSILICHIRDDTQEITLHIQDDSSDTLVASGIAMIRDRDWFNDQYNLLSSNGTKNINNFIIDNHDEHLLSQELSYLLPNSVIESCCGDPRKIAENRQKQAIKSEIIDNQNLINHNNMIVSCQIISINTQNLKQIWTQRAVYFESFVSNPSGHSNPSNDNDDHKEKSDSFIIRGANDDILFIMKGCKWNQKEYKQEAAELMESWVNPITSTSNHVTNNRNNHEQESVALFQNYQKITIIGNNSELLKLIQKELLFINQNSTVTITSVEEYNNMNNNDGKNDLAIVWLDQSNNVMQFGTDKKKWCDFVSAVCQSHRSVLFLLSHANNTHDLTQEGIDWRSLSAALYSAPIEFKSLCIKIVHINIHSINNEGFIRSLIAKETREWDEFEIRYDLMKPSNHMTGIHGTPGIAQELRLVKRYIPFPFEKSEFKERDWSYGAFIITGGLGALGLLTAKVLMELGVKHIVLVSRSGKVARLGQGLEEMLRIIQSDVSVFVDIYPCDVSLEGQVEEMLNHVRNKSKSPIRGIFHAAGVFHYHSLSPHSDKEDENKSEVDFQYNNIRETWRVKAASAWFLHKHTIQDSDSLEVFASYSSIACAIGGPGLAVYGISNRYLDELMTERHHLNLPAISIRFPEVEGIGMAAVWHDMHKGKTEHGYGVNTRYVRQFLKNIINHSLEFNSKKSLNHNSTSSLQDSLTFLLNDSVITIIPYKLLEVLRLSKITRQFDLIPANNHNHDATASSNIAKHTNLQTIHRHKANPKASLISKDDVKIIILREIELITNISNLDLDSPLMDSGLLDSLSSVEFTNRLSQKFGLDLSATMIFNYPSATSIIKHVCGELGIIEEDSKNNDNIQMIISNSSSNAHDDSIAIIGLSCTFPDDITSLASLSEIMHSKQSLCKSVSFHRWDTDAIVAKYGSNSREKELVERVRYGAFLSENQLENGDLASFGISQTEEHHMSVGQRLLLKESFKALHDSGYYSQNNAKELSVGVYVGASGSMAGKKILEEMSGDVKSKMSAFDATGNTLSVAAGRISYSLGLTGPCLTVDTACSSSLVALHNARRSLQLGECDLAVVAGVNILDLESSIACAVAGMTSPDGICHSFDESANGYARGEGCGVIILKRSKEAMDDNNKAYAVIKGSAVSQDGKSASLTAPNGLAQQRLIKNALKDANITAHDVSYIEAHGTGTKLGDPIETEALAAVFGPNRSYQHPLYISSIKANIGHLEAAAGMAGIFSAIIALQKKQAPPNGQIKQINQKVKNSLKDFNIRIEQEAVSLQRRDSKPLIAGVSSFGYSGTIAHVLLEEGFNNHTAQLTQRQPFIHEETNSPLISTVWQFSGQGTLKVGSGEKFYTDDAVYRRAMDKCDTIVKPLLLHGISDILYPHITHKISLNEAQNLINQTRYAQPVLLALQYCIAESYKTKLRLPDAVMGHSLGEFAAAVVAGVLSIEQGLQLVMTRGKLIQESKNCSNGKMIALQCDVILVKDALEISTKQVNHPIVSIAAINSHDSLVISGSMEGVAELLNALPNTVKSMPLNVSHAFHSPIMQEISAQYLQTLNEIIPNTNSPCLKYISTVTGRLEHSLLNTPDYWIQHLLHTVLFKEAIQQALELGAENFLEIGADQTLTKLTRKICLFNNMQCSIVTSNINNDMNKVVVTRATINNLPLLDVENSDESEPIIKLRIKHRMIQDYNRDVLSDNHVVSGYVHVGILYDTLNNNDNHTYNTDHTNGDQSILVTLPITFMLDFILAAVNHSENHHLFHSKYFLHDFIAQTKLDVRDTRVTHGLQPSKLICIVDTGNSTVTLHCKNGSTKSHSELIATCKYKTGNNIPSPLAIGNSTFIENKFEMKLITSVFTGLNSSYIIPSKLMNHLITYCIDQTDGSSMDFRFSSFVESFWINSSQLNELWKSSELVLNITWLSNEESNSFTMKCMLMNTPIIIIGGICKTVMSNSQNTILDSNHNLNHSGNESSPHPSSETHTMITLESIEIIVRAAVLLLLPNSEVDNDYNLMAYGMDSFGATDLIANLSTAFDLNISPLLIFNYPSINSIVEYLYDLMNPSEHIPLVVAQIASQCVAWNETSISIIGLSINLPGDCRSLTDLWEIMSNKQTATINTPLDRWNTDTILKMSYFDDDISRDRMRKSNFLINQNAFPHRLFNITKSESDLMHLTQKLLLMATKEALEDAGLTLQTMNLNVGVFVGVCGINGIVDKLDGETKIQKTESLSAYAAVSNAMSITAGRISYTFNFSGPCYALDTACSSSLVALHNARRSLQLGECDLAVVAGVNILDLESSIACAVAGMTSPDGICHSFDESANGYARGEGCGVIILKRSKEAMDDNNKAYAVIKGSAVSQDGKSASLTAPNGLAQQRLIKNALKDANITAHDVSYIEAHGTGTKLGDPIETEALAAVFGPNRSYQHPLYISSIKANIGHLEAAAGMAGIFSAIIALQKKQAPPNGQIKQINQKVKNSLKDFNIRIEQEAVSLQRRDSKPLIAGVSSFGYSGTIAHVLLEEVGCLANLDDENETSDSVWMFSGDDELLVNVGLDVWNGEQVFRQSMEKCDKAIESILHRSIISILYPTKENYHQAIEFLKQEKYALPARLALQYSLSRFWIANGFKPIAVIGQTFGEFAAAVEAGIFSIETALRLTVELNDIKNYDTYSHDSLVLNERIQNLIDSDAHQRLESNTIISEELSKKMLTPDPSKFITSSTGKEVDFIDLKRADYWIALVIINKDKAPQWIESCEMGWTLGGRTFIEIGPTRNIANCLESIWDEREGCSILACFDEKSENDDI